MNFLTVGSGIILAMVMLLHADSGWAAWNGMTRPLPV